MKTIIRFFGILVDLILTGITDPSLIYKNKERPKFFLLKLLAASIFTIFIIYFGIVFISYLFNS